MNSKLIKKWLDLYNVEVKPYHYSYFYKYYSGFSIRNRILLELCSTIMLVSPIFIGKFTKLSSLTNDEYYEIIKKFQYSGITFIRVIPFFVHYPLIVLIDLESDEDFVPEDQPIDKYIHSSLVGNNEKYEYIVIGSGAGGAPVASELAKAGKRVCVVEKGGVVRNRSDMAYFTRDNYIQNSLDAAVSLKGVTLISSGSSVGGTTSINLGTSLVPREEYVATLGNKSGLGGNQMRDYFQKVISDLGIRESEYYELNKTGKRMLSWAEKNGYEPFRITHNFYKPPDKNIDHTYPYTINNSTDRYYLVEGLKSGMKLIYNSEVVRVREGDKQVEIDVERGGEEFTLYCDNLIISTGALNTPNIIRNNQLGKRWDEAGDNFKIHPSTSLFAYSKDFGGEDKGIPQDIGFYDKKFPEILYEGISLPKEARILTQMGSTHNFAWWYKNADKVLGLGFLMKEEFTGKVRNYFGENVYYYNLSSADIERVEHGMLVLARAFFEEGAEKVLLPIASPNNEFNALSSLEKLKPGFVTSQNLNTAGFHPSGTAAFGRLIDTDFKLIGSEKIYVSDGSLLPDSPGVNPQLTIMALSMVLAEKLVGEV